MALFASDLQGEAGIAFELRVVCLFLAAAAATFLFQSAFFYVWLGAKKGRHADMVTWADD